MPTREYWLRDTRKVWCAIWDRLLEAYSMAHQFCCTLRPRLFGDQVIVHLKKDSNSSTQVTDLENLAANVTLLEYDVSLRVTPFENLV